MSFYVIGCGSMGKRRISHLLKMGVREIFVVDQREDRCREVAARFGVKTATSLNAKLLRSSDAILICVPPAAHLTYLKLGLEHNVHLFVEKPIAASMDGLDEILQKARQSDRVLAAGCNLRFHPSIRQIKELVDKGTIGPILAGHAEVGQYLPDWHSWEDYRDYYPARRAEGGGLDAVCDLDYLCWILGEIKHLTCFAGKLSSLEIDTGDVAFFLLRFESGAIVSLASDMIQREQVQGCKLIGEQGTIVWDIHEKAVKVYLAETKSWTSYPEPEGAIEIGYRGDTKEFVSAIAEGRRPMNDLFFETKLLRLVLEGLASGQDPLSAGGTMSVPGCVSGRSETRVGQKPSLERSFALMKRAETVIPTASQTFSKCWTQFSRGVHPLFVEEAEGCVLTDVDGNRYLDFSMALCPVILGYAHPVTTEAVTRQLSKGITYSLPHRLEVELAEELTRLIPCADMVRFGKNGSDATSAAVRVARAFTGRDHVIVCGYHGWQDWYIGTTTRAAGVPQAVRALSHTMPYNDLPALDRLLETYRGQVAAVMMEPVGVEPPAPGYLEEVREITRREGAVLIFDEVITGFRMHLGGAQAHFNVLPDIAAFGKSMGNGMPIAAVVGRREIMRQFEEVFFSATFGGEALSLAASLATIRYMKEHSVIETLWKRGAVLQNGLSRLITEHGLAGVLEFKGYPVRMLLIVRNQPGVDPLILKTFIQQECVERGLLFTGAHNLCLAHTEAVIEQALAIYRDVFTEVAQAIKEPGRLRSRLKGEVVQPVFRAP